MVGIFYSFEVKRLEKSKTEELFVPPQETATERSKLERQKLTAWIKILTPNKLLIKLPVLLALIKAENNLYKVKKTKSDIYYIFGISIIKWVKHFITINLL